MQDWWNLLTGVFSIRKVEKHYCRAWESSFSVHKAKLLVKGQVRFVLLAPDLCCIVAGLLLGHQDLISVQHCFVDVAC